VSGVPCIGQNSPEVSCSSPNCAFLFYLFYLFVPFFAMHFSIFAGFASVFIFISYV